MKASANFKIIAVSLSILALGSIASALNPAPDGGYFNANTAEGESALSLLTTGALNTAVSYWALTTNTEGSLNTAVGYRALTSNITGDRNTAVGAAALFFDGVGGNSHENTAIGASALYNVDGSRNTATGAFALNVGTGTGNTANGYDSLYHNTGNGNTATGYAALFYNAANYNSAFGEFALAFNTGGGSNNSAFGFGALAFNSSGSTNIALGYQAGVNLTTGSNNIDIGNVGVAGESSTIRIGTQGTQTSTYVAGIFGATVTDGAPLIVDTNGHLGTVVSSARFKDEIKPMDKASAVILALKPVTFRYKKETDPKRIPQFGLVAEDVDRVDPDLVIRDRDGKPYTVRYDAVNAMLLNEFLREHNASLEERHRVEKLEATVAGLLATVKEQAAKIQKVSAHIQMDQRATNVALSRR